MWAKTGAESSATGRMLAPGLLGGKTEVIGRRGKESLRATLKVPGKRHMVSKDLRATPNCLSQRRAGPPHLVQLLALCPFPHP